MIKLSIENGNIIIQEAANLKHYQLSQLQYFGYTKVVGNFIKPIVSIESDIAKIIEYFTDESVNLEVSNEINLLLSSAAKQNEQLSLRFNIAKEVKDGNFNKENLLLFNTFLNRLPRKLKQHQIKSAFHLYSIGNGANFSVPGSGKTSVVLSVYEKLKEDNICNILFVIGPPACFQPWKNEFYETLGRQPNSIILSGGNISERKSEYYKPIEITGELYLSTFQTILNDCHDVIKFLSQKSIKAFVVIDEAHYIKQIGGSWANALMYISEHAMFKCILTGTPIPRSYKDLFNLFDFLWNSNSPLKEADKIQIDVWEKNKNDEAVKELLNEKVGPLFYRVRKKDLGLLDPNFHPPILVEMNAYEKKIYQFVNAKILELSQDEYFENEGILNRLWQGRMIRLRQALSYSKLLDLPIESLNDTPFPISELKTTLTNYDKLEIPAKVEKLIEMVRVLLERGQKVLIWSNFIGTLHLLKNHFLSLDWRAELIYGKTPRRKDDDFEISEEKTREDIRDEFIDPKSGLNILIANPAACSESISLHKTCFNAIYYDLSYNCAQYLQSLDRIHRVGGSEYNQANYYFLQYRNSLDQDIKKSLDRKAQRMYDLIEQDYVIYNLDLYEEGASDDIDAYKRIFLKQKKTGTGEQHEQ
ncbi:SNF2-related protein [Dinghuibacter silviterrae]|uniref:Helicase-like protein n=1 Tax=Dinghuibacter silviterrae TaxID=1539049 RepID=A0A4R8DVG9_9BACT|nr:DEAD/DEAH box helicase [Dinghuibacter silviterrae]TDX02189.1 helicase-like protein [Dinghuibacter silviterrae]